MKHAILLLGVLLLASCAAAPRSPSNTNENYTLGPSGCLRDSLGQPVAGPKRCFERW